MTTYFNFPSEQLQQELAGIAKAIVAPGKGLKTSHTSKFKTNKYHLVTRQ